MKYVSKANLENMLKSSCRSIRSMYRVYRDSNKLGNAFALMIGMVASESLPISLRLVTKGYAIRKCLHLV